MTEREAEIPGTPVLEGYVPLDVAVGGDAELAKRLRGAIDLGVVEHGIAMLYRGDVHYFVSDTYPLVSLGNLADMYDMIEKGWPEEAEDPYMAALGELAGEVRGVGERVGSVEEQLAGLPAYVNDLLEGVRRYVARKLEIQGVGLAGEVSGAVTEALIIGRRWDDILRTYATPELRSRLLRVHSYDPFYVGALEKALPLLAERRRQEEFLDDLEGIRSKHGPRALDTFMSAVQRGDQRPTFYASRARQIRESDEEGARVILNMMSSSRPRRRRSVRRLNGSGEEG